MVFAIIPGVGLWGKSEFMKGQVAHMNEIEKKLEKYFPPFVPQGSIKDFKKEKILNVNFIVNQSIITKLNQLSQKK